MQNPRPELEEVENEREHLVDQDVHGHVDPDMEEDSEELEESQTEQSSAPVSLLSPAEPVDSVEILTPEWRLPYEQRIAWQTAEDEIWKDAINQKVGLVNNFFIAIAHAVIEPRGSCGLQQPPGVLWSLSQGTPAQTRACYSMPLDSRRPYSPYLPLQFRPVQVFGGIGRVRRFGRRKNFQRHDPG